MIATLAVFLFILWLFGTMGMYTVGPFYHALLIASIMLMFIAMVRSKKPAVTEIMINNSLSETEAEQVEEIMNKKRLNEREAVEFLNMRLRFNH